MFVFQWLAQLISGFFNGGKPAADAKKIDPDRPWKSAGKPRAAEDSDNKKAAHPDLVQRVPAARSAEAGVAAG